MARKGPYIKTWTTKGPRQTLSWGTFGKDSKKKGVRSAQSTDSQSIFCTILGICTRFQDLTYLHTGSAVPVLIHLWWLRVAIAATQCTTSLARGPVISAWCNQNIIPWKINVKVLLPFLVTNLKFSSWRQYRAALGLLQQVVYATSTTDAPAKLRGYGWHQGIFLLNNCRFIQISEWPSWSSSFFLNTNLSPLRHWAFIPALDKFSTRWGTEPTPRRALPFDFEAQAVISIGLKASAQQATGRDFAKERLWLLTFGKHCYTTDALSWVQLVSLRPSSLQKASAKWQPPVTNGASYSLSRQVIETIFAGQNPTCFDWLTSPIEYHLRFENIYASHVSPASLAPARILRPYTVLPQDIVLTNWPVSLEPTRKLVLSQPKSLPDLRPAGWYKTQNTPSTSISATVCRTCTSASLCASYTV